MPMREAKISPRLAEAASPRAAADCGVGPSRTGGCGNADDPFCCRETDRALDDRVSVGSPLFSTLDVGSWAFGVCFLPRDDHPHVDLAIVVRLVLRLGGEQNVPLAAARSPLREAVWFRL